MRTNTEAVSINKANKEVLVRNSQTGATQSLQYDKLILSPGAEPVRPPIPGIDNPRVRTLRSIADMDEIIRIVEEGKQSRSLIVGGGYIGLEMAEALKTRGLDVTLVEVTPQVMGPVDHEMAAPIHQQLKLHGIDLRLETSVTHLEDRESGILAHMSTGDTVEAGLVIIAVGVRPDVKLAKEAGLTIGERGGIVVDDHMRTDDPDIYAVGDAVEVKDFVGDFSTLIPLAGPANRQGRIAADNALGRDVTYKRTQGTGICKVFDLAVGMTGLNEKSLKRAGTAYEKVYVHPASHASYYPGASPISLKLLFDPNDGKILGAQAVGSDGVDKRIDVISVAIRAGLTVYDLEELELSYAPPYGSAKDPVNYAGFVASNVLRGDVGLCHVEELLDPCEDQMLLDVRTPMEVAAGTIPGAVNISLQQLRDRIGEIPKDKELLIFCQVGLRGYLACRILSQKGYKCRNLTGGYKTFSAFGGAAETPAPKKQELHDDSGATCPVNADEKAHPVSIVKNVDASGLQCPGPIMSVFNALQGMNEGEAVEVTATDPGFAHDIEPWCHSTGNRLVDVKAENSVYKAVVMKGSGEANVASTSDGKKKTIVVFSDDFDKVVAAFVIANGAASMGSEVTMFFTFWGLNVLRKPTAVSVQKNVVEKMFGWMMPRGANKLKLSQMHMGGMGLAMIKDIMRKKNVPSLPDFITMALKAGVKLVACTMSMDLMGIKHEEMLDGVEVGGVAMYLDKAEAGNVNLFI